MTKTCVIDDCERLKDSSLGYCSAHYKRWKRGGNLTDSIKVKNAATECSVDGCKLSPSGKGLCLSHYNRERYQEILSAPEGDLRQCETIGCKTPKSYKGHCGVHARELKLGNYNYSCKLEFCDLTVYSASLGLCAGHRYQQMRGQEFRPIRIPQFRHYTSNGYVQVKDPDHPNAQKGGYLFEHVQVMSGYLKRPLIEGENVHHINGVKDDNRIENLELWSTSQPAGQRIQDKIDHAKMILATYGEAFTQPSEIEDDNEH